MLTHTVLVSRQGRKLPCSVEAAKETFTANPRIKMIQSTVGHGVCYQFAAPAPRKGDHEDIYEMYSQRS